MSWLNRFFGQKEKSGTVAKNRLQMVLIHDRSNVTPGLLEQIKDDINGVIDKRLEIDPENVVINLAQTAKESRLVAEIPLAKGRRRDVIV
jgi:cell division topological specificity factor